MIEPDPDESWMDAIVEVYKQDVDRTLLRKNLRLTPEQRIRQAQRVAERAAAVRAAGRRARSRDDA